VSQLRELAGLVESWANRINLTGHRGAEAVVRRLVLDAAALSCALPEHDGVADLGSGAGFPGIPLAILSPAASFILVEARQRRHYFQRAALRQLDIANVEARRGRVEELPPTPCSLVIAQAVAKPALVVDLMLPWGQRGGYLVIPGGVEAPDPGPHAAIYDSRVGSYQVPLGGPRRSLWIGRIRGSD
jgi:16S rRNA (guanine527-N7)-methyltransferase